jgi:hypothetical protein
MFKSQIYILLLVCISLIINGCQNSSENVFHHPDSSLLPKDEKIDNKVRLNDQSELVTFPVKLEKKGEINPEKNASDEYYYYRIPPKNIQSDLQRNVYVLQAHTSSINVFNQNGKFLYKIGRKGNGPGEFNSLKTFSFSDDYNELYALDHFKIEVFVKKQERYTYDRTYFQELQGSFDMCIMDDYIYISGYKISKKVLDKIENTETEEEKLQNIKGSKISKPIHRLNRHTGEYEFEFGYLYQSENRIGPLGALLSETMLSCNKDSKTVTGIIKYYPFVFGYDTEGNQKWISKIEGFKSIESIEKYSENGKPSLVRYSNSDVFNRYLPVRSGLDEYTFIQVIYSLPQKSFASDVKHILPENPLKTLSLNTVNGEMKNISFKKTIGTLGNGVFVGVKASENKEAILSLYNILE